MYFFSFSVSFFRNRLFYFNVKSYLKAESRDLVVLRGGSYPTGHEFESQRHRLHG